MDDIEIREKLLVTQTRVGELNAELASANSRIAELKNELDQALAKGAVLCQTVETQRARIGHLENELFEIAKSANRGDSHLAIALQCTLALGFNREQLVAEARAAASGGLRLVRGEKENGR